MVSGKYGVHIGPYAKARWRVRNNNYIINALTRKFTGYTLSRQQANALTRCTIKSCIFFICCKRVIGISIQQNLQLLIVHRVSVLVRLCVSTIACLGISAIAHLHVSVFEHLRDSAFAYKGEFYTDKFRGTISLLYIALS